MHKRRRQYILSPAPNVGRAEGWNDAQKVLFEKHLKRYPRGTGHYSTTAQDKYRYFQDEDLSRVIVWKDFLKIYHKVFWDQATRVRFWKTHDTLQYKENPSGVLEKPKLAYYTACEYLSHYDVSFKSWLSTRVASVIGFA
jgi:hypothetical protein